MTSPEELFKISQGLGQTQSQLDEVSIPLDKIEEAATTIGKSWSGSALGYHSKVYYEHFTPPPWQCKFSQEWGLTDSIQGSVGDWVEYDVDVVKSSILELAGKPDFEKLKRDGTKLRDTFDEFLAAVSSILSQEIERRPKDLYLENLRSELDKVKPLNADSIAKVLRPGGQYYSRDLLAFQSGIQTPPHIEMLAVCGAIRSGYKSCVELGKLASRAASHLSRLAEDDAKDQRIGTRVFIGHGRAHAWRDLKDFISERLRLPFDEFNRVPVAGFTNIARLSQMLDNAVIAFLIMTAEDEQADGKMHARMNVIHEAGLFQGRLGFERAILLLEEGCEEFSNVQGLGQIRFPAGNISAVFEDIRRVLEREEIIPETP